MQYDKLPILSNGTSESTAGRSRLTRRQAMQRLLSGTGVAFAVPALAAAHPIHRHLAHLATMEQADTKAAANEWKAEFLNPTQDRLLVAIAERMAPGSAGAQVNRIIDLLLSIDSAARQETFVASLSAVDSEAEHRFAKRFPVLTAQQQDEVLTSCASGEESVAQITSADPDEPEPEKIPVTLRDHFENLKGWIVGAYYSTEIGMRELGWTEDFYFEELPACTHDGEHALETTPQQEQQVKRDES